MPGLTAPYEQSVLNYLFGGGAAPKAATVWVGLLQVLPGAGDPATHTEVTGSAYARANSGGITNNATSFPNASGGAPSTKSNGIAVTFAAATGNWTTAVGFGIFDAASGGNLLAFGSFGSSITVNNGSTASFAIGALIFTTN